MADMELSAEALVERMRQKVNILFERGDLDGSARNVLLDTLSPPEPEQPDEATKIWREVNAEGARACGSIPLIVQKWRNGEHDNDLSAIAEIAYLRQVLSELIASKDAEKETAVGAHRRACKHAKEQWTLWEKRCLSAENELAALRAEIARLKSERDDEAQLANNLEESLRKEHGKTSALRAERDGLAKALAKYVSFDQPEAAERNTAEPEYDIYAARMARQRDEHIAARIREEAADTAPVVEVTQK